MCTPRESHPDLAHDGSHVRVQAGRNARRTRRPRPRGFALLDVLVGGILLSIALVSVMGVASQAMRSQILGEEMQRASMMLDEVLEEVLMVGPERFRASFPLEGERPEWPGITYELRIEAPGRDSNPYRVTATARWVSGGRERSIVIPTMIAPLRGDEPDPEREPEEVVDRDF